MSKKTETNVHHLGGFGAPPSMKRERCRRNGLHMGGFTAAAEHPSHREQPVVNNEPAKPSNKEAPAPTTRPMPTPANKTPLDKPCGCSGS